MVAAGDGDIDKVRSFLDNGVSPNQQDNTGYSAMLTIGDVDHL